MKNPILIIIVLVAGVLLFGCTGSSSNASIGTNIFIPSQNPTNYTEAYALAKYDNTKFALYLIMGENNTPFSGTVHFMSSAGRKDVKVPEFIILDRSDICGNKTELYNEVLVTFDDSPVNETWTWGNASYCKDVYFNPWITEEQMASIKDPAIPLWTKMNSEATLNPGKLALVLSVDNYNKTISGTMKFGSSNGTKEIRVPGTVLINRSDLCTGKVNKYSNMTIMFDDSQINETRFWGTIDACGANIFGPWVTAEDYESLKNPRFNFTFFEYENKAGNPIDGALYCDDVLLGSLQGGNLEMNKTLLLQEVGEGCSLSAKGNFQGHPFDFCGWYFNATVYKAYSYYDFNINKTIEAYFRRVPCSTTQTFITPEDPVVTARLRSYLPQNTGNLDNDLQDIFRSLAEDYVYDYDSYDRILSGTAWYDFPSEFFVDTSGVCADWGNAFLSLAFARDPNAQCYGINIDFVYVNGSSYPKESHLTVMCVSNGAPRIFDQNTMYSGSAMWQELFDNLDWKGSSDERANHFSKEGVTGLKPTAYYNKKVYVKVDGIQDMYRKLGLER